jgi:hypothetical protein
MMAHCPLSPHYGFDGRDFWSAPGHCARACSEEKGARLIGVEYIIAGHLFDNLPEEEKK